MPPAGPANPILEALRSAQVATWDIPLERVALHLRAVLVKQGLAYEDLGRKDGRGIAMEAFAIVGKDLSVVLFEGAPGATSLALGEGVRTPTGLGRRILQGLEENLQRREARPGAPPAPLPP